MNEYIISSYYRSYTSESLVNEWPLAWWRNQMETLSALLALCAGNSTVTGELTSQMPVAWSFDVFVDLRLKRLSKQSWGWLFETPSRSLWRHCNGKSLYYSLSSRTKIVSKIPYNRYRYNVVHYSTILHTALQWLKQKINKKQSESSNPCRV